nr:hypothetical protein [Tanacetum cinerariifolium]
MTDENVPAPAPTRSDDQILLFLDANLLRDALEITPIDQPHQFVSPPLGSERAGSSSGLGLGGLSAEALKGLSLDAFGFGAGDGLLAFRQQALTRFLWNWNSKDFINFAFGKELEITQSEVFFSKMKRVCSAISECAACSSVAIALPLPSTTGSGRGASAAGSRMATPPICA